MFVHKRRRGCCNNGIVSTANITFLISRQCIMIRLLSVHFTLLLVAFFATSLATEVSADKRETASLKTHSDFDLKEVVKTITLGNPTSLDNVAVKFAVTAVNPSVDGVNNTAYLDVCTGEFKQQLLQIPKQKTLIKKVEFFNGKDLTGWKGNGDYWSVKDGAIVGHSEKDVPNNKFIWSSVEVKDFYLTVDVKLTPDARNAGIQFRSKPIDVHGQALGYQADVGAGVWGKLYHEHGRGKLDWNDNATGAVKPDQWNAYEILAVGDRIWTAINGKLCVAFEDPAGERAGKIAFQIHGGPPQTVHYRNPTLKHNPKIALKKQTKEQLLAALPKKVESPKPVSQTPILVPSSRRPRLIAAVDPDDKLGEKLLPPTTRTASHPTSPKIAQVLAGDIYQQQQILNTVTACSACYRKWALIGNGLGRAPAPLTYTKHE